MKAVKLNKLQLRKLIKEEIGKNLKTKKFSEQIDVLKDPRFSVDSVTINKGDAIQINTSIKVYEDESLSTSAVFSNEEESTHWARNTVRNIISDLESRNP